MKRIHLGRLIFKLFSHWTVLFHAVRCGLASDSLDSLADFHRQIFTAKLSPLNFHRPTIEESARESEPLPVDLNTRLALVGRLHRRIREAGVSRIRMNNYLWGL